jgi:uncharacterized repeat protein (TIGR03803 family)
VLSGGIASGGTIFGINTDGTGFGVLHAFSGGDGDGLAPYSGLTPDGSRLYGTTYYGGTDDAGTIFQIDTDDNEFQILHSFGNGVQDGRHPYADLILLILVLP